MKRVYPKEDACIDCKLCEVACLVEHSETKDIFKAYREAPRTLSKAFVEEDGPNSISIQCRHCTDAPCIDACITGAMQRADDDSPVIVDRDKCVGCWMCIMACPFGAIQMDIRKRTSTRYHQSAIYARAGICLPVLRYARTGRYFLRIGDEVFNNRQFCCSSWRC